MVYGDDEDGKREKIYNPFLLPPAVIGANGENNHNFIV